MLRVHNLLVTLDGYATGDGQSLDGPARPTAIGRGIL
jgi:hypothetical protein